MALLQRTSGLCRPSEAPVNGLECPGLLRLLSFLARVAFAATLGARPSRRARAGRRSRPSRPWTCARCRSPCRSCASRPRPRSWAGRVAPRAPGRGLVAVALLAALVALAAVVSGRGPAGLAAEVSGGARAARAHREWAASRSPGATSRRSRWAGGWRCVGRASCASRPPVATRCGWRGAAASACRERPRGPRGRRRSAAGRSPRPALPPVPRRSTSASITPGPARACVSAGRARTAAARRSRRATSAPRAPRGCGARPTAWRWSWRRSRGSWSSCFPGTCAATCRCRDR